MKLRGRPGRQEGTLLRLHQRSLVKRRQQRTAPRALEEGSRVAGKAARLRVERQTHLPANRSEAWKALESLADPEKWQHSAAIFSAMESIYWAECQKMGTDLQVAFRRANDALDQIPMLEEQSSRQKAEAETELESKAREAFANDTGAAGRSARHDDNRQLTSNGSSSGLESSSSGGLHGKESAQQGQNVGGAVWQAVQLADTKVREVRDGAEQPAASGPGRNGSASLQVQERESVDESEVLALQSVDFENASRMEYDRSRRRRIELSTIRDPQQADRDFMNALLLLLRRAHFVHLSSRDEALARSLNSDYVAQIFISPDTRQLDEGLVAPVVEHLDVPEQARAMLVFKRGYGQARRNGSMLVGKLDYLQYVVVRSFVSNATARIKHAWRSLRNWMGAGAKGEAASLTGEQSGLQSVDEDLWTMFQRTARQAATQLARSGILSPRFLLAGGGLFMTLSNWGLLPQVDVEPLGSFKEAWKPAEPHRLAPVFVERVSLRDAFAARRGVSLQTLLGSIELIEPTFQELLVMYRQVPNDEWLPNLRRRIFGAADGEAVPRFRRRNRIQMRIYRDVPLPTWKIVFPDKLLQFRPLDGLRADLLTVAGLVAFIAQAKYDSVILELITLSSALVLLVRVVLGYKRMNDRFDKMANEMLADTTTAGQEGVIAYLATSAALQQFAQSSLAYLVLLQSEQPLNMEGLCVAVESMLQDKFQVKVRFDAAEALSELERLGLAEQSKGTHRVCAPDVGLRKLKRHWDKLLLPDDRPALSMASEPRS